MRGRKRFGSDTTLFWKCSCFSLGTFLLQPCSDAYLDCNCKVISWRIYSADIYVPCCSDHSCSIYKSAQVGPTEHRALPNADSSSVSESIRLLWGHHSRNHLLTRHYGTLGLKPGTAVFSDELPVRILGEEGIRLHQRLRASAYETIIHQW